MTIKNCKICKKKYQGYNTSKYCSKCKKILYKLDNIRHRVHILQYRKKIYSDPESYEKLLEYNREYNKKLRIQKNKIWNSFSLNKQHEILFREALRILRQI